MKIKIRTSDDLLLNPRLLYTLDFIKHHPYWPSQVDLRLASWNSSDEDQVYTYATATTTIPAQRALFDRNKTYLHKHIKSDKSNPYYVIATDEAVKDVLESIFYHISRYEEYYYPPSERNQWDMMPEKKQFAIANDIHHIPYTDHLVKTFIQQVGLVANEVKALPILSHDIDYTRKKSQHSRPLHFAGSLIKRNPLSIFGYLFDLLRPGYDPYLDLNFLSNSDLKKVIYFHVGGDHEYDPDSSDQKGRDLVLMAEKAKSKGYELGLHPSYSAAVDESIMRAEKNKYQELIGAKPTKSRQHYLHFDFHKTVEILKKTKLRNDSSLGYNEHVGFRSGTQFQYRMFNFNKERRSNVSTTPLVWMDTACWYESGKNPKQFMTMANSYFDKGYSGAYNFHNTTFYDFKLYGMNLTQLLDKLTSL